MRAVGGLPPALGGATPGYIGSPQRRATPHTKFKQPRAPQKIGAARSAAPHTRKNKTNRKSLKLTRGWVINKRSQTIDRGTERRDRWSTALHEAAHAVAAERLGGRVTRLEILAPTTGNTQYDLRTRRKKYDPVNRIMVALAGHMAEVVYLGKPLTAASPGDHECVLAQGCSPTSITLMAWTARRWVRWWGKDIKSVARSLFARGSLDRRGFLEALHYSKNWGKIA